MVNNDFYKNIHFIDYLDNDFYDHLPTNVILIGGNNYDINLEKKIKEYDCVIRIHNYRAINCHIEAKKNNIKTKTDYVYTFIPRGINFSKEKVIVKNIIPETHIDDISNNIQNLKGIIFQVYPYSYCEINKSYLDENNKNFIKKLYQSKKKNKILNEYNEIFANRNHIFYIEYISKDSNFIPTYPNKILEYCSISTRYDKDVGNTFTTGMRCLLNLINSKKSVTLCGFSIDSEELNNLKNERLQNDILLDLNEKKCYSKSCFHNHHDSNTHCADTEVKIIQELLNKKIIKIL